MIDKYCTRLTYKQRVKKKWIKLHEQGKLGKHYNTSNITAGFHMVN